MPDEGGTVCMLLAVGHFHYVADYLCDYSLFPQQSNIHMHKPEHARKHRINQDFKRKECVCVHTHTIRAMVVMREFLVSGWQHTYRLSSGERLSVKNEQFWLSISANLNICVCGTQTQTYKCKWADTQKRSTGWSEWVRANIRKIKSSVSMLSHTGETCFLKKQDKRSVQFSL